jgi:cytochrome P450/NADPH-cytochrome P450 reductase
MLKNPATYFAAQKEVDRVVGSNKIEPKHLNDLKYINAVLRETLRLNPTAPAITRGFRPGKYEQNSKIGDYNLTEHGDVLCLLSKIQRDPKVYGPGADEFKPERMLDGNFEKLPKNAWKVSKTIDDTSPVGIISRTGKENLIPTSQLILSPESTLS